MKIYGMAAAVVAAMLAFGTPNAQGAAINGELKITGSVIVDDENIDWTPPGSGEGVFNIDPFVNTGFFTALGGTSGTMLDLNLATAPVGVPNLNIVDFMTFAAAPTLTFTLDYIAPGPFSSAACFDAPAAGQVCTFPGSPFGLSNATAGTSVVDLVLRGMVTDGSGDLPSTFVGTFSTQFNVPYQQLLDIVFVQGGSVNNTYSATLEVNQIPEPGTVLLFGAGLLGIAWLRKRS